MFFLHELLTTNSWRSKASLQNDKKLTPLTLWTFPLMSKKRTPDTHVDIPTLMSTNGGIAHSPGAPTSLLILPHASELHRWK